MQYYLIDDKNSNSYEEWKKMGSPQNPTADQIRQLEKAGQLQLSGSPRWLNIANGEYKTEIELKRQAVAFLKLSW